MIRTLVSSVVLDLCIQQKHNIKIQTVGQETAQFLKKVRDYSLYHIFCKIFREKYFLLYILLTDQISLPLLSEIVRDKCQGEIKTEMAFLI